MIGGRADARAEGERPINPADDLGKGNVFWCASEEVSAGTSADALYDAALLQLHEDLFEEFPRQVRFLGDVRDQHWLLAAMAGKHDEGMERVASLLGEHLDSANMCLFNNAYGHYRQYCARISDGTCESGKAETTCSPRSTGNRLRRSGSALGSSCRRGR